MCPIKTENLALNVPRMEAQFWRGLASRMGARSRGDLQKNLLLVALEHIDRKAAGVLRRIRQEHRTVGAAIMLAMGLFAIGQSLFSHDQSLRRASAKVRVSQVRRVEIS